MENDDYDVPQLSAETFAALQEFYREQDRKQHLRTVSYDCEPEEDWHLSQFWYDDETVGALRRIAERSVNRGDKVALISCPTLYNAFKENLTGCDVHLYEYDRRFSIYGKDFVFYDYNSPLELPNGSAGSYDLVIADPPFLSEECLSKTVSTMKRLGKGRYILCTGAVMGDLAGELLSLTRTSFEPRHRNNLANEFRCYSNYDVDAMLRDS